MLKNQDLIAVLIRLFLGYIFFSAGICKLTHGEFGQLIGPPWLEEGLAKYGLGLFAKVVAVSQVICGALLLSQRFSLLGAVMLVPMNVAILGVTTSMNWVGTPYINTIFLLLNLLLLGLEHRKFSFLIQQNKSYTIAPTITDRIGQDTYSWLGLVFCLLTMAMAFVSITFTNLFALVAFACFATTIIRSGLLHKLDVALILLPFVAMVTITYSDFLPQAQLIVAALVTVEALLLAYRLFSTRKQALADVMETVPLSS